MVARPKQVGADALMKYRQGLAGNGDLDIDRDWSKEI